MFKSLGNTLPLYIEGEEPPPTAMSCDDNLIIDWFRLSGFVEFSSIAVKDRYLDNEG